MSWEHKKGGDIIWISGMKKILEIEILTNFINV